MESKEKEKSKDIKIDKASFISYKTNNISKDYTLGKTLGQGSFGTVRKAVHKATKQERAIKILKKSAQDEEKFFLEVNILSKLTGRRLFGQSNRVVVEEAKVSREEREKERRKQRRSKSKDRDRDKKKDDDKEKDKDRDNNYYKRRSGPKKTDICYNCGKEGHWANECIEISRRER